MFLNDRFRCRSTAEAGRLRNSLLRQIGGVVESASVLVWMLRLLFPESRELPILG